MKISWLVIMEDIMRRYKKLLVFHDHDILNLAGGSPDYIFRPALSLLLSIHAITRPVPGVLGPALVTGDFEVWRTEHKHGIRRCDRTERFWLAKYVRQ